MPKLFIWKCKECMISWQESEKPLRCKNDLHSDEFIVKVFTVNMLNEEKQIDDVGNLTKQYIEENKIILDEMKKDAKQWNGR